MLFSFLPEHDHHIKIVVNIVIEMICYDGKIKTGKEGKETTKTKH